MFESIGNFFGNGGLDKIAGVVDTVGGIVSDVGGALNSFKHGTPLGVPFNPYLGSGQNAPKSMSAPPAATGMLMLAGAGLVLWYVLARKG